VSLCRDPADNMLLECCIEAKAGILISGDHDLLQLRNVPFNLRVLTPRKFIEEEWRNKMLSSPFTFWILTSVFLLLSEEWRPDPLYPGRVMRILSNTLLWICVVVRTEGEKNYGFRIQFSTDLRWTTGQFLKSLWPAFFTYREDDSEWFREPCWTQTS